jgi:phenylpropionate dioxygenase-like ring-hydroxylating dioxygenase large terminal subunit
MIRNQWYAILDSREVKTGRPVGVTRLGEKLVLWRTPRGQVACLVDRCPHLGAQLSQGRSGGQDEHLACPFHGFQFDSSGQCIHIPALGKNGVPPKAIKASSYLVYEAHDLIWIYWGQPRENLAPPRFFDIDDSFSYCGYRQHWPVHYSRMVENQLDVMHLPFVHANTIGAGGRTVVDGPVYTLEGDMLRAWVSNRVDDGRPALKPKEMPVPQGRPSLEFIFPNIWQLCLAQDLRIFVAFVPVDEENGMFYLRQYQRIVRVPLLRELFNWFSLVGNRYIAEQDRRVVIRQLPKKTDLNMGEKLLPPDALVLAYRRRRKELQDLKQ